MTGKTPIALAALALIASACCAYAAGGADDPTVQYPAHWARPIRSTSLGGSVMRSYEAMSRP